MCNCNLPNVFKRTLTALLLVCSAVSVQADSTSEDWSAVVQEARGGTVFFYAWGGSSSVNQYLRWAGQHLNRQYGINLRHVKVSDIAEAVHRLRSDQAADRKQGGAIDLLWINGENFHALKDSKLLEPDLLTAVPNHAHLLVDQLPLLTDFGVPVDGLEVPWGMGQFNMIARKGSFGEPTITPQQILDYAQKNPGRLSYPKPPDFVGTTLLKSLLQALTDNDERLYREPSRRAERELLPELWGYLDQLHPLLWDKGRAFPQDSAQQLQWLADGQLSVAFSFNPQEMRSKIRKGRLPDNMKQHYFSQGAITNSHYLAVPRNASNKAAAKVVINFLISRSAQERKADPRYWGDPAVIQLDDTSELLPTAQELHAGWQELLEEHWLARYQ